MLERLLFTAEGRVIVRRMVAVVAACVVLALFGSFLLVLTPAMVDHEGVRTLWVLFSVFLLKFPLVALLSWLILRNKEWPVHAPTWSDEESREILDYLGAEAVRAETLPDREARLQYLRGEAWNIADRIGGERKADAVDMALHIDSLLVEPRMRRRAGG